MTKKYQLLLGAGLLMLAASLASANEPDTRILTDLRYTGAHDGTYAIPVTVAAHMDPIVVGATVVFQLNGGESCSGQVDGNGIVSCAITPMQLPGEYPLTATYAGSPTHLPSQTKIKFTVHGQPTKMTYTGETSAPYSRWFTAGARMHPVVLGATVVFTLNGTETCSATVDGNGIASCGIAPGEAAGVYPITAVFAGAGGYLPSSDTVAFTVEKLQGGLTYDGATSGYYRAPANVSATLGPIVAGAPITFVLGGSETCTGTADAAGRASCALTPDRPVGTYSLVARFPGDGRHHPAQTTAAFSVTRDEGGLSYTGDTYAANMEPMQLSGVLRTDAGAPIAGRAISFTIGAGLAAQTCTGTTNTSGAASCTIAAVDQPLGEGDQLAIAAVFAGDPYFLPALANASARLQYMTGQAYALSASMGLLLGRLDIARMPFTGDVRTADAAMTPQPCALNAAARMLGREIVAASALCSRVITDVGPGSSVATASIANIRLTALGLLPMIRINGFSARSEARCDGATGSASIATLSFAGIDLPFSTAPNTTIPLPLGARITINEQIASTGSGIGMTVNAVHIVVPPLLGLAGADIVLGSATSAIHNCKPAPLQRATPDDPARPEGEPADDPSAELDDDAAALDPGGCSTGRADGALWLIALALGAVLVRRRRARA